jgi:hypothetical protein
MSNFYWLSFEKEEGFEKDPNPSSFSKQVKPLTIY